MCPRNPNAGELAAAQRRLTAWEAIQFADERLEPFEVAMFIRDFRTGDLEPWPEFADFLAEKSKESTA